MKFGTPLFSSYSITFCAFYRSRDPISGFFRSKAHFRAFLGALSRLSRSPPFEEAKNQPFGLKSDHALTATKINALGRFGRSRPNLCDFSSQGVFKASKVVLAPILLILPPFVPWPVCFSAHNPQKRPFLAFEAARQRKRPHRTHLRRFAPFLRHVASTHAHRRIRAALLRLRSACRRCSLLRSCEMRAHMRSRASYRTVATYDARQLQYRNAAAGRHSKISLSFPL